LKGQDLTQIDLVGVDVHVAFLRFRRLRPIPDGLGSDTESSAYASS
jgi:hypothetical protein